MELRQHQERVAIVTGGGRGIGRSMVLGLVRAGVHVIATAGRERSEIEAVAREAEQSNAEASVVPLVADVTNASDCEITVDAAVKRFGRLDILVNNAGRGMKYVSDSFMTEPTRFWEISPETWRQIIHKRQRAVPDGKECGVGDDKSRLGTDHQHLSEPADHAAPRILALWSVEGCA